MAVTFHWARVRAFCNATEDPEIVKGLISGLTGSEEISVDVTEGHHGNPITILEVTLKRSREINAMYKSLGLEILGTLLSEIDERMDDDCIFYVRLDKQPLVAGEMSLSTGGDSLFIHGKVVAHPARKDVAMANLRDFLTKVTQP